jgi:hypothetical protein
MHPTPCVRARRVGRGRARGQRRGVQLSRRACSKRRVRTRGVGRRGVHGTAGVAMGTMRRDTSNVMAPPCARRKRDGGLPCPATCCAFGNPEQDSSRATMESSGASLGLPLHLARPTGTGGPRCRLRPEPQHSALTCSFHANFFASLSLSLAASIGSSQAVQRRIGAASTSPA